LHPDIPDAMGIDAAERRAWDEDGFFVREVVFAADELAALGAAAERVVARVLATVRANEGAYEVDGNRYQPADGALLQWEHTPGSRTLRVIEPFHHLDPAFDALVDDARLVEPMRALVGDARVALWTDKLNLKRPREGSGFRFHQDSPYWAFACRHLDRLPNVMLTLDDASAANGCFRIVRGSHRRGLLPGLEGQGKLGPLFTDPRHFDASQEVPIEAPAGSLVFFSPHSVHGSEPNRSDRPRRAAVLTYQPGGLPMFQREGVREAG
jgi:ectoine hydroxylase-related dioxygenase (phytanoyl-CoA dioxygenase family)